jgi:hypothetical protein
MMPFTHHLDRVREDDCFICRVRDRNHNSGKTALDRLFPDRTIFPEELAAERGAPRSENDHRAAVSFLPVNDSHLTISNDLSADWIVRSGESNSMSKWYRPSVAPTLRPA